MHVKIFISPVELVQIPTALAHVLAKVLVPRIEKESTQVEIIRTLPLDVRVWKDLGKQMLNQSHSIMHVRIRFVKGLEGYPKRIGKDQQQADEGRVAIHAGIYRGLKHVG